MNLLPTLNQTSRTGGNNGKSSFKVGRKNHRGSNNIVVDE